MIKSMRLKVCAKPPTKKTPEPKINPLDTGPRPGIHSLDILKRARKITHPNRLNKKE